MSELELTKGEVKELREGALCRKRSIPVETYFQQRGGTKPPETSEAIKLCYECPVRSLCIRDSYVPWVAQGVWGGLSHRARQRLLWEANHRAKTQRRPADRLLRKDIEDLCT